METTNTVILEADDLDEFKAELPWYYTVKEDKGCVKKWATELWAGSDRHVAHTGDSYPYTRLLGEMDAEWAGLIEAARIEEFQIVGTCRIHGTDYADECEMCELEWDELCEPEWVVDISEVQFPIHTTLTTTT